MTVEKAIKPSNLSSVGRRVLMQLPRLKERPDTLLDLNTHLEEDGWECRGTLFGKHDSQKKENSISYYPEKDGYDSQSVLNELFKGKSLVKIFRGKPKLKVKPKDARMQKSVETAKSEEKTFCYARDVAGIKNEEQQVDFQPKTTGSIKIDGKTFYFASRGVIFEDGPQEIDVKLFAQKENYDTPSTPLGRLTLINARPGFISHVHTYQHPSHERSDVEKIVHFLFSKKFVKE